uniref:uncharacterized protein LOC122598943 n=1 Tax=Erigeron canadensis TaxID=72917 RepID=UPI001CB93323|nr:uncharacterized protein LOC122598943 [Erigeron canadensis]
MEYCYHDSKKIIFNVTKHTNFRTRVVARLRKVMTARRFYHKRGGFVGYLQPDQVTRVLVTDEVYDVMFHMRNSDLYTLGISSKGHNSSEDFGQLMELLDYDANRVQQNTVLENSIRLGNPTKIEFFRTKYQHLKELNGITHDHIKQAVSFVGENLYRVNDLSDKELGTLKKHIELLVNMIAESMREDWIEDIFDAVLNHGYTINKTVEEAPSSTVLLIV